MDNGQDAEYFKRNSALRSIGFKSYSQYLDSDLWDLIRRETLARDQCRCRNLKCVEEGPKHVHHLAYSLPVLFGNNPVLVITLCEKCHTFVEFDGPTGARRGVAGARKWSLYLASGCWDNDHEKNKRNLRNWMYSEFERNQVYARQLYRKIKEQLPDWHEAIRLHLTAELISPWFKEYLGLKKGTDGGSKDRSGLQIPLADLAQAR